MADEVRALAQRTSSSTDEIQEVLDRLHTSVSKTGQAMEKGRDNTTQNMSKISDIASRLGERAHDVDQVANWSQSVASLTSDQQSTLTRIGQQLQSNAQSVESLSRVVDDLVSTSEQLGAISEDYRQQASQFKF